MQKLIMMADTSYLGGKSKQFKDLALEKNAESVIIM